jgi:hypothetical protein
VDFSSPPGLAPVQTSLFACLSDGSFALVPTLVRHVVRWDFLTRRSRNQGRGRRLCSFVVVVVVIVFAWIPNYDNDNGDENDNDIEISSTFCSRFAE